MIRLLLLGLILAAMAWVSIELLSDHRRRRRAAVLDPLRSAFLHGAPLAPDVRVLALQEIDCAGLRLSLPASWRLDRCDAGMDGRLDPAGRITLRIEALLGTGGQRLERPAEDASSAALADGARLTKRLSLAAAAGQEALIYEWILRWADEEPPMTYRLLLTMPLAAAGDVLRQSDVTAVERAVREARRR
jgi:hypothetical protein